MSCHFAQQILSYFAWICCGATLLAQPADTLLPVNEQGKWGFVNTKGIITIPCQYESVLYWGTSRYGKVKADGKWNLITRQGNLLPLPIAGIPQSFNDSILLIRVEDGQLLVHENGNQLLPKKYNNIKPLENGFFCYYEEEKCGLGHINQGIITAAIYDQIHSKGNEGFEIISCKKSGWINTKGEELLAPIYESLQNENGELFLRLGQAYKLGIYDCKNNIWLVDCIWDDISEPIENFQLFSDERGSFLFNRKSNSFYPDAFQQIDLINDFARVKNDKGVGIFDKENKLIIPIEYESIEEEHGLWLAQKDSSWIFFKKDGSRLNNESYKNIQSLSAPAWVVERRKDWILLDSTGRIVLSNIQNPEVLGNKVKYYQDGSMTSFQVNKLGQITGRQSYDNVVKLQVSAYSEERSKLKKESPSSILAEPDSRWFKDEKSKKWGLKFPDGKIAILPCFDFIVQDPLYPYTHVYIRTYSKELELFKSSWNLTALGGLVENKTGKVISDAKYVDVFLTGPVQSPIFFGITSTFRYQLIVPGSKEKLPLFAWVDQTQTSPVRCLGGNGIDRISVERKDQICSIYSWISRINNPCFLSTKMAKNNYQPNQFMGSSLRKWVYVFPGEDRPVGYFSEAEPFNNSLAIVRDYTTKLVGLMNQNGAYMIPCNYAQIKRMKENEKVLYLLMKSDTSEYLINSENTIFPIDNSSTIINYDGQNIYLKTPLAYGYQEEMNEPVYFNQAEKIGNKCQGIVAVYSKSKWKYYIENKQTLNEDSYSKAFDFINGKALVKDHGKWKFLSLTGELSEPLLWKNMKPIADGKFIAHNGKKWFLTDSDGKSIQETGYSSVSFIKNSPNIAVSNGSKWGLISPEGEMLIDMRYKRIQALGDDLYALNKGKHLYLKHEKTKEKKLKRINGLGKTAEGRIALSMKNGWVLADTSLKVLGNEVFAYLRTMSHGYTIGKIGNRTYLVDSIGQIAFKTFSRLIGSYSDGFILSYDSETNRYKYLTNKGENIFASIYIDAWPFSNGKAWVKVQDGWGCIDSAGEWIINPHYYKLRKLEHDAFAATSAYSYGLCDSTGNMLLEPNYDKIEFKDENLISGTIGSRVIWKYTTGSSIYEPLNRPALAKTP
jgi:hypothetical protein